MKFQELVVNGCSYMEAYSAGSGHHDLADRLNIPTASSLALSGCANQRILRTTIKHSAATTRPTFYVLGMTFLARDELPILDITNQFEGAWTNPQNQARHRLWIHNWTIHDTDRYVQLKQKWESYSVIDRFEDLQYRLLTVIDSLLRRGHGILIYNQCDHLFKEVHTDARLQLFRSLPNVIQGYNWMSIPWQHEQGVPSMDYAIETDAVPENIKHRESGRHAELNEFLVDHINSLKLLQ